MKGWEHWEHDMAELFDLDQTITSGNKFFDPGDAVTRGRGAPFPLYADAKYTEKASKSIAVQELRKGADKAAELGRRFILPLRFHIVAEMRYDDWVLISAHDFAELLEMVNARD